MSLVRAAVAAYALALVALSLVHIVFPQRNGLVALSQIFAPHLFLVLLPFAAIVLLRGTTPTRLIVLAAVVFGIIRFGPGMVSLPASAAAEDAELRVLSWNLAAGEAAAAVVVERLRASDADIVGLQELNVEHAEAIEDDPVLRERFPHRVLDPGVGVLGMGLLSSHPISESRSYEGRELIVATVEIGDDRRATVATAHPLRARIRFAGSFLPVGYDARERDRSLAAVREAVAGWGTLPVILIGDFNVTDREPAYADMTANLVDAHASVGLGTGSTWRPPPLDALPFGMLRIDYIFTGNGARPLSASVDCIANAGDHCVVSGVVAVP